ncbi:hypothetical protein ACJMK2_038697 [Sinanodonta woodiana]|uniref:Sodefrin-like factor n=1 Tax=Sinanodonta woodiana TaxID=1069815 RepID=A0ABD3W9R6_SINWO
MDSILTPSLHVIFNGGCRSKAVCRAGAGHTGKRAIESYVICSSCCNATNSGTLTECNANLCGLTTRNKHSNQCYYCGDDADAKQGSVYDPSLCRKIKACADDEVCRTTTSNTAGIFTYEFGCSQLLQCQLRTITDLESQGVVTGVDMGHLIQTGAIVGRKRQTNICDICCGDGLCNDAECQSVRSRILTFAKAGRFNYTTLRLIR